MKILKNYWKSTAHRQSLTFLTLSFGRVSMQCPYILNGKVGPSSILFGDDKASLKTSVEAVEPSFDNPPVIHQDEFPTLARKRRKCLFYKWKSDEVIWQNHIVWLARSGLRGHSITTWPRWGGRGSKNVCFCPRSGYKNCPRGRGCQKMTKFCPRSCWMPPKYSLTNISLKFLWIRVVIFY